MSESKEKKYVIDNPQLMAGWNWAKNNELGIDPNEITCGSKRKVWWICEKGHEWDSRVCNRAIGIGCPYCSGRNAINGQNDLEKQYPNIAKEWHPTKNGTLSPNSVKVHSNKNVWWLGVCGHEWQATVTSRTAGSGCPYCSFRKLLVGFNDLETVNPDLVKEWNYEKNGNLLPQYVLPNYNKKVWWRCAYGHEWEATIVSRNNGSGCPICANERRKRRN